MITTQQNQMVQIRTYTFQDGVLHLVRGTMSDEEVAEYYEAHGPPQEAWDDEMDADKFWNLPDFADL